MSKSDHNMYVMILQNDLKQYLNGVIVITLSEIPIKTAWPKKFFKKIADYRCKQSVALYTDLRSSQTRFSTIRSGYNK